MSSPFHSCGSESNSETSLNSAGPNETCSVSHRRMAGGSLALRKAFKYFDKDNSGDIDPDEFLAAMDWFGLQFTEDCVMALYGIYDTDRGGSLGYAEFVDQLLDGMADRGTL